MPDGTPAPTPRPVTGGPLHAAEAPLCVSGAVVHYRLYDVGYEIHLERALDVLAPSAREREALRRPLPPARGPGTHAILIGNPPITISVGTIAVDGAARPVEVSARIFDFGVISLRLRIETPGTLTWPEFSAFGNELAQAPGIQTMFERHVRDLTDRLRDSIARPGIAPVTEDYVVYRIDRMTDSSGRALPPAVLRDLDVAPLLLGEERHLSDDARRALLPYWFSYYVDDLAILTWNNALVVEPAGGGTDVELILEFANAQLLELRYYDALLDAELPKMYDRIANARAGHALLGHRYAPLLAGLQTLVADSTEIVERAENSLKVTDDVYLARVHAAALELFRGRAWRRGIDHKLAIIRQTYAMLNAELMATRNEVLEGVIIVLIVVEIVLAIVLGKR
jgi:hypothetical protein